ncbi:MAG: hypothetical protein HYR56_17220 [Acidobacteria bacterium]|nr:hypothetical protein [Acidobacteriota bacterium]MBI3426455.1 hypothetical protein [Acidobacteriota bacterium]
METLKDELLNLAFQLAHFIHNDKELAKRIAVAALEKLETAALAQDKRLYYPGRRNKVSMTELHLLQRLVYAESEPHERAREEHTGAPPNEEALLIHFIKHLAKITARRNAMHVTLGVSRLLHQYTTPETTEIYNAVVQDPARVPSEDYFRSRKKTLMEELKKRFGTLLNTTRVTRGEERFVAHPQPERFIDLTRECLNAFTPWLTACCVPAKFALAEGSLNNLAFHGGDPDAEHSIEINRFHAILHPTCFERLVTGLGYAAPVTRLEIPRFFLSSQTGSDEGDEQNPHPPNRTSAKLDDEERNTIRRYLSDQSRRRKYLSAGLLLFVADGELLAQLDTQQNNCAEFTLPDHAEFVEVRTRDDQGELLLATQPVLYDVEDQPQAQRTRIVLEGGQRLSFEITPTKEGATVTVSYTETNRVQALQLWWQRQNLSAMRGLLWQPALGLLLLAVSTTLGWLLYREHQVKQRAQAELAQTQTRQQSAEAQFNQLAQQTQAQLEQERAQRQAAETKLQQLQTQLERRPETQLAQLNIPAISLRLTAEKGVADASEISVPAQAKYFLLSLERGNPREYTRYTVEVLDARKRLVKRIDGIDPRLANNRLNVLLRCADFSNGQYWLRLSGHKGGAQTELGEYAIALQFE